MFLLNYSTLIDPLLQDVRIYTAKLLSTKPTRHVLDICCGTGDQVFHYRQKGLIAAGIDQDHSMISQAEEKRRRHSLTNIDFYIANATNLPFREGYFDSVSLCLGLHEMNEVEQDKVIREMKRTVKKGGTLIFIDFLVPFTISPLTLIVRAVEFLAGKRNYHCFSNYLSRGGLKTIIRRNQLGAYRTIVMHGLLEVIEADNPV
jgi:demethylmenaquinone methyltransferase/2-methoxy-6-polyprenyl-1,4-benzoquinol methylase